ncbi:hypothetical protein FC85_GL001771 [Lentilactobacillus diolivorans DSM 14421]|jgi:hypothetical protein|uniref:GyrI-like small molecule binding domain-containing protein n=2 Tax=Lentilactobacillus diolivorans TaxID=179838 RepID=A0A0R1S8W1_9LACO|nr:hypothetical protein FC85_GL001771 [Lentilactobacillus diolivorans DSM 14421]
MKMFNWETYEPDEYSKSEHAHFVDLTTRSYITAEGHATKHTDDPEFLRLAKAAARIAKTISGGPEEDIPVSGFKAYVPYPVQAVWRKTDDGEDFKIWIKQPLFIDENAFKAALEKIHFVNTHREELHFEQLAEGIEVQTINHGPIKSENCQAFQVLNKTIKEGNYKRTRPNEHREVYIDSLPVTPDSLVLIRFAIDLNGQPEPDMVRN